MPRLRLLPGFSPVGRPVCVALFALAAGALGAEEAGIFRAGAAVGDITPDLGAMIIGGFSPTPAKHVHDPLQVRALVLDDGGTRLALVVCDKILLLLRDAK